MVAPFCLVGPRALASPIVPGKPLFSGNLLGSTIGGKIAGFVPVRRSALTGPVE
jgi:hypothetical protein